ncbi:MAG: oxygen-independent coproporphyrinogen III oxidase [Hyphomicrobiales bacterium]
MIDQHAVLAAFPASVPRYTSYPTAPKFQKGSGPDLATSLIAGLNEQEPVSIYIHIPFCDRLCWFCGCHTKHTLKYAPVRVYIDHLLQEIAMFGAKTSVKPRLKSIHLGGGSPSLLQSEDMARIRNALTANFLFDQNVEISVEIDPSDVTQDMYDGLGVLGVTRASIGVQDFHPDVQKAINRPQTFEQTAGVVSRLREMGVTSINVDALYGLPLQTTDRLQDTLRQCLELTPDRLALFGYAHIPWFKKHQKMIRDSDLPSTFERFNHANMSSQMLQNAGYQAIGIDHFAKPDDSLSVAANSGRLHRNFQGYTTDSCPILIGFGASSIGRFVDGYIQNTVATGEYQDCIKAGKLPTDKGIWLSSDDKIRAHIIERLMCDFRVCLVSVEQQFGEKVRPLQELAEYLAKTALKNLCLFENDVLSISPEATPFTRIIASHFDAYYEFGQLQYSKAV